MRRGSVWKRCTKCGARVPERRCPRCGGERFTWTYKVDLSIVGQPRTQFKKGGFATKAAATAAMNTLQVKRAEGTDVTPSKSTVGQFLERWMAGGCGGVRPWTLRGYTSVVRNHIIPRIGHVRLQALTRTDVKAFYADLLVNGYAKGPTQEQLERLADVARRWQALEDHSGPPTVAALARDLDRSPATVRHWVRRCHELGLLAGQPVPASAQHRGLSEKSVYNVHICLRAALYDAIGDKLIRENPAAGAMREPDGEQQKVTWTREELGAFLDFVKGERDHAMWRAAGYTGMRRGELLGLRWSDVKWNLKSVSVQQQLGLDDDDDGERDFAPPKTKYGRRAISLDDKTLRILRDHRAAQDDDRRTWGPAYRTDLDLVFCRPDGTPEDPDAVTHRFHRAVELAGLKPIGGPHGLRHTHATLLLEAGVDISVVSHRLGHASVAFTGKVYAHVTARLQVDAAAKFSDYVDGREDPDADS